MEEKPYDLKKRTKKFALEILKLIDEMPKRKSTDIISYQLGKSGSSVVANFRAAQRVKSTKDFINKLKISEEECDESKFWLEMLIEGDFHNTAKTQALLTESNELLSIIVKSIRTSRENAVGKN